MATAAKDVTDAAVVILSLSPNDIQVGDRLGAFWPDKAAAIGRLMAEDSQNEPIKVKRNGPRAAQPWKLVAGHHRLEGAKLEGFVAIDAIEVFGDEAALRKIEASENIERGSRSPIERACFVRAIADAAEARLKDQHGDLTPEQIAVRARWDGIKAKADGVEREDAMIEAEADHTWVNFTRVYGWRAEVAAAIGMSVETVKKDLALHRALVAPFPDLYRSLATHPIVGENASALREIASIKDITKRGWLIEALVEAPDMTLAQALEGLGFSTPKSAGATGATKYMDNAGANIARLSAEQQRSWAPALAEAIKPSALEAMRDAINARLAEIQTHREGVASELEAHFKSDLPPTTPAASVDEKPVPAVAIRASVKPDYLVCLDCGEHQKMLKRHLMSHHQLTVDAYLTRWQLPRDYPMVAPNYAEERRRLAKRIGLAAKGGEA